jgi:hypothetical protein
VFAVQRARLGSILVGAALGLALAVLSPASAAFAGGQGAPPTDPVATGGGVAVSHRCLLYANQSGFGADCAAGKSHKSAKEILGVEDFATCRDEPIPDDVSTPRNHIGEEGAWYLETCLKGINPDGTGDFTRTTEVLWFPKGKPIHVLTQNQQDAWNSFQSTYPSPTAQFGPATAPRVLIPTFFWLTDSSGATITRTVFDGTQDVEMEARVVRIEVSPGLKDGEEPFPCDAPLLHYDPLLSMYNQPSHCSYEYHRSSANKVGHIYQVIVKADWVVRWRPVGGEFGPPLGAFSLSQITKTPVDEIQTVVE